MGDSHTFGPKKDCGDCTPSPVLLDRLIAEKEGVSVKLLDASQWNKLTAAKLLAEIRSDNWGGPSGSNPLSRLANARPAPRKAIARADMITLGVGFNSLPWITGECHKVFDAACRVAIITPFVADMDAILSEIDSLRGGRPTAVRVTTPFNDVVADGWDNTAFYGPTVLAQGPTTVRAFLDDMVARTCAVVRSHGAKCVNLYRAFNGPNGKKPLGPGFFTPKFGDLNQPGQERVAAEIMKLGFAPLTR